MNARHLEFFVRVAEQGSFTRAADMLGVSQPVLSRSVRQLELELREHLLYRTGRGVELTEAGKCLMGYGNAILELLARAKGELRDLKSEPTGRVAVGLPPRIGHVLTTPLVDRFRRAFPKASITIAEALSSTLREWLLLGRIEIAALYDPAPSPKLEFQTLARERMALVGRNLPGRRIPARVDVCALEAYPLILPSMPHAIRTLVESACRARNVRLNVVAEIDTVQSSLALAQRGPACAILPESAVSARKRGAGVAVGVLQKPEIRNRLVLAVSRHGPQTRLALETAKIIIEADIPRLLE